jgi:hypothetical protein
LHEDLSTSVTEYLLLRMKNIAGKVVEKINIAFCVLIFSPKIHTDCEKMPNKMVY